MAITQDDLLFMIQADTSGAVDNIKKLRSEMANLADDQKDLVASSKATQSSMAGIEKQTDKITDSLTDVGASAVKLNSILDLAKDAWGFLAEPINRALNEANKATTAFDRLKISLKAFGDSNAAAAARDLDTLADSLERVSGIDADELLGFADKFKSFGFGNEQIKEFLKAIDALSARMGGDVKGAGDAFTMSLLGQEKALAKLVPELKGVNEIFLRTGGAADVINKKFEGLSEQFGKTAAGIEMRYQAVLGKVFEELGKTINEVFGLLGAKESNIELFESIAESIEKFRERIKQTKKDFEAAFNAIAALNWKGIAIDIGIVSVAILALNTNLILLYQNGVASALMGLFNVVKMIIPYIQVFIAGWGKVIAVTAIAAAKIIAITAAISLLVVAIETMILNFDKIGSVFELFGSQILKAKNQVQLFFYNLTGNEKEAERAEARIEGYGEAIDELKAKMKFGPVAQGLGQLMDLSKTFSKNQYDLSNSSLRAAMGEDKVNESRKNGIAITQEAIDKQRDLFNLLAQLNAQAQSDPRNEVEGIRAKASADKAALSTKILELAKVKELSVAEKDRLQFIGERLIEESAARDIYLKQQDALKALTSQTENMAMGVASFGQTQREILELQLQQQLRVIDLQEQELKNRGLLTEAAREEFAAQRNLATRNTEQQRSTTQSSTFENAQQAGADFGKELSGSLSDGLGGLMAGMASGAGMALQAAQAVVDIIPQLLDGVANLIGSVTELPLKILDGVTKILNNLGDFFTNFIGNIGTMISGILEGIVGFIEKIPEILIKFITDIPNIIVDIFNKLPDLIQRLVTALIEASPRIAIGLISFLVKDAPKIAISLMKTLIIELPKALIKGIVNAVKNIWDVIFGGGSFKSFLTKDIPNAIGAGLKKLSGVGSKLFEVKDLAADALSSDRGQAMLDSIEEAGKEAYSWITRAWMWVRDNILMPLWDIVTKPFIYAWEMLKITFRWVVSTLETAWDGLKAVAYFVRDLFMSVWNFVKGIFQGIIDSFMALWRFVTTVFDNPIKAFKQLWEDIKNIFSNALSNFGSFFSNLGQSFANFGSRIWDGFVDAFKKAGNFFSDIGGKLWEGIKSGFGDAVNFFKNLFKFDGGGTDSVEEFFGFDFPFFAFADGGVVPGYAPKPGDDKRNDIIPALLSPGEMVMPRTIVKNPAYRKVLDMMFLGQEVPQFAWYDDVADAIGDSPVGTVLKGGRDAVKGAAKYVGRTISNAGNAGAGIIKSIAKGDLKGVAEGFKNLLTAGVPQEIIDLFKSVTRFVSDVDLGALVKDPEKEIKRMIKSVGTTFLRDPFRELLANFPGMAEGGLVTGFGNTDNQPRMLMPGEFVMSKPAVQSIGVPALAALNSGQSIGSGSTTYNFDIDLKIETREQIDDNYIRQRLVPTIGEALKRESEAGRYVLSLKGTRP